MAAEEVSFFKALLAQQVSKFIELELGKFFKDFIYFVQTIEQGEREKRGSTEEPSPTETGAPMRVTQNTSPSA